jgi:hypothetical protein
VLQKKPHGWSNIMGGGLGSRKHNDYWQRSGPQLIKGHQALEKKSQWWNKHYGCWSGFNNHIDY